jgi:hypothetical protein
VSYFFDNNIAPAIPEALRALCQDTVHISDCANHGISRGDADVGLDADGRQARVFYHGQANSLDAERIA